MKTLSRQVSMKKLLKFAAGEGAGLVFVQGRRRVGKTWLLQEVEVLLKERVFRLLCRKHRRDSSILREFAAQWSDFSGQDELTLLRSSALTWQRLMAHLGRYAVSYRQRTGQSFVLIIDEIQWLSTSYDESAGVLKAAWDEWARDGAIRIVICGSSTRFFTEQFGEGSVLRGLQTHATLKVLPFPVATLRREAVPKWTARETVLAYMCLGGIPYYWRDVRAEKGFRRAMNDICCTSSSIFLGEWREIIATEFRTDAVESLARLFPALMSSEEGVTQAEVAARLGIEVATVARLLDKLVAYGYVFRCIPEDIGHSGTRKMGRGIRYILGDFFLHFYFSVLYPLEQEIRLNHGGGLLFPSLILEGDAREYIPSFTGKAFERFVFYHLDIAMREGEWTQGLDDHHRGKFGSITRPKIWELLDLPDANYEVRWNVLVRGKTNDRIRSQIDVLVVHQREKSVRLVECKWKGAGEFSDIEEVQAKLLPKQYEDYVRRDFLVVSYDPSADLLARSKLVGVTLITLDDFL